MEVGEEAAQQGDPEDATGKQDDRGSLLALQQRSQPAQGRGDLPVEQQVIEDELERPRREQLRHGEPSHAEDGDHQAAPHVAQVRADDRAEGAPCLWRNSLLGSRWRDLHQGLFRWLGENRSDRRVEKESTSTEPLSRKMGSRRARKSKAASSMTAWWRRIPTGGASGPARP